MAGTEVNSFFFPFYCDQSIEMFLEILPQRLLVVHEYRFRLFMQSSRLEQIEKSSSALSLFYCFRFNCL